MLLSFLQLAALLIFLFFAVGLLEGLTLPRLYRMRIINSVMEAERVGLSDIGTEQAAERWLLLMYGKSSIERHSLESYENRIECQLRLMEPHTHLIDQNLASMRDAGRMHPAC